MQQSTGKNFVTGVDIGGTHITACMVDLDELKLIESARSRRYIDSSADADTIISAWADVIKAANGRCGFEVGKVGIAMPGPFDYQNGISLIKGLAKFESFYGINVKEKLANALSIPAGDIKMLNDATAYLAGEYMIGSGKGAKSVLGITLGTGLGSAWYMNGQLHDGDLYCFPFKDSVAEDYISARWLVNNYHSKAGELLPGVHSISERARMNDQVALELFSAFGRSLAGVILGRFRSAPPEKVVLGGNIALSHDLFLPACQEVLTVANINIDFAIASLGESAALIGAGCLWK